MTKIRFNPLLRCSGVSKAAKDIEEAELGMLLDYERWQASQQTPELDVERESVVLMPPIKSRTVRLHIREVKRGNPLVYLED